ncbi:MAG: sulfatase-like hydrolase/transferase [Acidobacteriota bacterium]|nr:sulfatase-like hydrolase/transferase [Acidobacteriota bacterium]
MQNRLKRCAKLSSLPLDNILVNKLFQFVTYGLILLAQSFAEASAKAPTNVVLITIDTVRSDRLGCYGAKDVQTPTLDGLARDGIVFERAISQVPLTWPSHAAILTGMYPFQNGVQDFTGQPLDSHIKSIAQSFQERGYATGAVVSAFVLDRSWGLARGFDFYDDAFSPEAFQHKDLGLVDRKAGESVSHAIKWLSKTSRPFFFWLHLYDPHTPYDPPEPYHTQYRDHLYDGEIAYADHELGRLMSYLKQNNLYDRSLIIFLSDHGESMGEHGENEHGFFVYNSTVHIPLIAKPPVGSSFHTGRVSMPVETVDVAPTMLRLAGIRGEKQFQSRGLLDRSPAPDDAAYSETFYPFSSFGWSPLHALETSRYHYIASPNAELYDLSVDPLERNNLESTQPAVAAVLRNKLQTKLANHPFIPPANDSNRLSPDAMDKLRDLGYVAYRAPVPSATLVAGLPDPKNRLLEFQSILQAADYLHADNFQKGEEVLAKIRKDDPQIYLVPFMLGEAAIRQKKWKEAVSQFTQCLALNPNFDQAMTALAHAHIMVEELKEARHWLDEALKFNPQNYRARYELASIERRTDPTAAIADYQKAVSIQPNFALLRRDFGMVLFDQSNFVDSAKHLQKAVDLGVHDAPLYNFLGISYSRTGRLQKAVKNYREALRANPNYAEAHLNLAYAYQRLNRWKDAHQEYKSACSLENQFCKFQPQSPAGSPQ